MERMEMVEILREKTGCSYSEAKAALEETGDELLEALCWLETHGKIQMVGASCSTEEQTPPKPEPEPKKPQEHGPFVRGCKALWKGIVDLLRWGNRNELVMRGKAGKKELSVPITLLVCLLLIMFWVVVGFGVVALFCGCRFSLEGPDATDEVNDAMGKATDFAEGIRDEMFSGDEDSD